MVIGADIDDTRPDFPADVRQRAREQKKVGGAGSAVALRLTVASASLKLSLHILVDCGSAFNDGINQCLQDE